jgi:hypothetical protein
MTPLFALGRFIIKSIGHSYTNLCGASTSLLKAAPWPVPYTHFAGIGINVTKCAGPSGLSFPLPLYPELTLGPSPCRRFAPGSQFDMRN